MAGGKETPRQKMIGMMYLVLTALLALNVTKEVVNAFVTINDKLDASAEIVDQKVGDDYQTFDAKKASIIAQDGDLTDFNLWNSKADSLEVKTRATISYLLGECNAMIEEAEGISWVAENGLDEDGNITKLKPLMNISVKDNYDIPTQLFIGSNPLSPIERGLELRNKIHAYRDMIATSMATYSKEGLNYSFIPPNKIEQLGVALSTVNPIDTAKIAHFYRSLTIPETLFDSGEEQDIPWVSATFNHAPIVAAAAMFTALKVDVKNAESIATEYLLDKITAPIFTITTIEPMAFASSAYINQGDSLGLSVLIAAYDSNAVNKIRWGMDEDTIPERWKEEEGRISLDGTKVGFHKVKGAIGVKERGNTVWKDWEFDYTVGQPMGVISQPDQRFLYRGYENEIAAAASGFPADKVSISVSSGCSVSRKNGNWIVEVGSGVRKATISVRGEKEDGSVVTVASNEFEIKPMPKPEIFLGGISGGQKPGCSSVRSQNQIRLKFPPSVTLSGVQFKIIEGTVLVEGINGKGKILRNGTLDENAKKVLRQACGGKQVTIICRYADPSGVVQNAIPLIFTVR